MVIVTAVIARSDTKSQTLWAEAPEGEESETGSREDAKPRRKRTRTCRPLLILFASSRLRVRQETACESAKYAKGQCHDPLFASFFAASRRRNADLHVTCLSSRLRGFAREKAIAREAAKNAKGQSHDCLSASFLRGFATGEIQDLHGDLSFFAASRLRVSQKIAREYAQVISRSRGVPPRTAGMGRARDRVPRRVVRLRGRGADTMPRAGG